MPTTSTRNYDLLTARITACRRRHAPAAVLAQAAGYDVYRLRVENSPEFPWVLLLAGVHGDEPAGVEALMRLLEVDLEQWAGSANFDIIPCVNPFGYAHDTRGDAAGRDLNWSFEDDQISTIRALRRLFAGRRFLFTLDMHEDWESPGYYLYELYRGECAVGANIVRRVEAVCPLNRNSVIEGHTSAEGLLVTDVEAERERRGAGTPLALFDQFTDHLLTSESPTSLSLESRVEAHRMTFDTVMQSYFSEQAQSRRNSYG